MLGGLRVETLLVDGRTRAWLTAPGWGEAERGPRRKAAGYWGDVAKER